MPLNQDSINRRRQLAAALQEQSMLPIEAPNYPGAQISPWQGAAKLAQALFSALGQRKANKQQEQLDTQRAGETQAMIGSLGIDPAKAQALSAALSGGNPAAAPILSAQLQGQHDVTQNKAAMERVTAENAAQAEAAKQAAQEQGNRDWRKSIYDAIQSQMEAQAKASLPPEDYTLGGNTRFSGATNQQLATVAPTNAINSPFELWRKDNPGGTWEQWAALQKDQTPPSEPLYPVFENGKVVYKPRSQAAGMEAPRTVYDAQGNPTTGGMPVSLTPPPSIPEGTQTSLTGWKLAIDQIDKDIIPQIQKMKESLGPLTGRITLAEITKLGGLGASKEQIQLATDMRRLLMSQAFAEGGKQLTPTEKEEFVALNPALTDTFDQAMIKAQRARDYLDRRYKTRLEVMPARQRGQLPASAPKGDPLGIR
jgi:hypothetical protein